jgi:NADH-quinone oxidoreductase subunit E
MSAKKKTAPKVDPENTAELEPTTGTTGAKVPGSPSKASVGSNGNEAMVRKIVREYPREEPSLIMVLQEIQDKAGWLSSDSMQLVADELGLPLAKVRGVATFYKAFSLEPRGEKVIKVCLGTACHVRGAGMLVEELERDLKVKAGGGMTEDGKFSVETVNCVGACAMAPVVVVEDNYHANMTPGNISAMLKKERS